MTAFLLVQRDRVAITPCDRTVTLRSSHLSDLLLTTCIDTRIFGPAGRLRHTNVSGTICCRQNEAKKGTTLDDRYWWQEGSTTACIRTGLAERSSKALGFGGIVHGHVLAGSAFRHHTGSGYLHIICWEFASPISCASLLRMCSLRNRTTSRASFDQRPPFSAPFGANPSQEAKVASERPLAKPLP